MSDSKKIQAKCINNDRYQDQLTIGKIYEVETTSLDSFYKFIDDQGEMVRAWQSRFEVVSETPETTMPITTEFKVGDKVKIRKDSRYYGRNTPNNPVDIVGIVIRESTSSYEGHHCIRVEWPEEFTNTYQVKDLELAEQSVTIPEPEPEISSKWANVEIGYY